VYDKDDEKQGGLSGLSGASAVQTSCLVRRDEFVIKEFDFLKSRRYIVCLAA
jgi:hypothetical protein